MSEFKITGPGEYRTRDGRKAIVAGANMDAECDCFAVGWISQKVGFWYADGRWFDAESSPHDLVAVWTDPRKGEFWINVYEGGQGSTWLTREDADRVTVETTPRLACIHVQWTEGDGL